MENPLPWEKLAKYFAGEFSEEQKLEFEKWINSAPERKKHVKELHKIWRDARNAHVKVDITEAWDKLALKMDEVDKRQSITESGNARIRPISPDVEINRHHRKWQKNNPARRKTTLFLLAASIVMAVSVSVLIFNSQSLGENGNQTESSIVQELSTKEGERATYVLSDGSRVVLHAESRLDVPVQFSHNSREIYLQGEAYFEVEHDPSRPFIVRSENSQTRVLGTKFLIKAWSKTSRSVEVIVTEGEVSLGRIGEDQNQITNEINIRKNQLGVLHAEAESEVTNITDIDWYMGWTTGKLIFDDRSFNEILTKLERWYVIDIKLDDASIGDQRLSAEIDYSQPMIEVLEGIALSLNTVFERDDRTITFRRKG